MAWLLFTSIFLIYLGHTVTLEYKRVCYYTNWAQYRNGSAKFEPKNVDPSLCTHLVYAFGTLQNSSTTNFEWNDEKRYGEINSLKKINTNLKTLLALGGWNAGSKPYSDMAYAVEYWLNKGAPKEKLVLGLATYGRSFILQDLNITGVGAPATGPGPMGSYVHEDGVLPYYDICERQINKKGITYRDEKAKTPYLVDDTFWVGFDDRLSIYNKVTDLVIGRQLGGAMIWVLDFDDFNDICGYGSYPISNQINTILAAAERGVTVPPPSTDIPAATLRPINPKPNLNLINDPIMGGSVGDSFCSNVPDGFYQHSLYCSKYIECVGGKTYERDCPSGLRFSFTLCRCEWQSNVNCSIKQQVTKCNVKPPINTSSYHIFSCQSSFIIYCLIFLHFSFKL